MDFRVCVSLLEGRDIEVGFKEERGVISERKERGKEEK